MGHTTEADIDSGKSTPRTPAYNNNADAQATKGILETIDAMSVENTGKFTMVPTDGSAPKEYVW